MTQEMKPEPTDMASDPVAALGFTPEALDTIEQLATALYADGQLESALKLFQGLLVLRPDQADSWSAVGAVLTQMEQYEEALPYLSAALALDPDHTPALVTRAECLLALGQVEEAAQDLDRAIALDPQEQDPASNRARQLVLAMHTFFEEAHQEGLDTVEVEETEEEEQGTGEE